MGTDQYSPIALHEIDEGLHLAGVTARRAKVVALIYIPVSKKAVLAQFRALERGANGAFWNGNNRLLHPLVVQLVQRDKHQRTALSGGRRCFDQQVLAIAALVNPRLHLSHPKIADFYATACPLVGDFDDIGHVILRSALRTL